jgi:hypothetical protein
MRSHQDPIRRKSIEVGPSSHGGDAKVFHNIGNRNAACGAHQVDDAPPPFFNK